MRRRSALLFWLLTGVACLPMTPSNSASNTPPPVAKKLRYQDYRYEQGIKSDLLYPDRGGFVQDKVQSPVIALNGGARLVLEFDELYADYQDYNVKLIHCTTDWKKSPIPDMEFTFDYNEYAIRDFEYSQGALIPYTHYTFAVPRVRLPGNYLLVVYRDTRQEDLVLTRRFVVFDSRVQIKPVIAVMTGATGRFENHQIEMEVNYRGLDIMNPYTDVKVVIRQNQRWDNAITELKPTQVREDRSSLFYRHFTGENTFTAVNEFRQADLRSTSFRGRNIADVEKTADSITVHVAVDRSRKGQIYSQYSDLNGSYVIENNDPGADYLEEDYLRTFFYLEHEVLYKPVYLMGGFNHWQKTDPMTYDPEKKMYVGSTLLKQGFYDYLYYVEEGEPHPYQLEGAYFEAENDYDVIFYYTDPRNFTDLAVGFISFNSRNGR